MIVKSISLSSHVDAKRKVSISTFQEIEQKHSNLILKNITSNSPLNIQITLRFYSQIVQIYEMKFNREIKSDFKLAFFKERGNKYTARKIIFNIPNVSSNFSLCVTIQHINFLPTVVYMFAESLLVILDVYWNSSFFT